MITGWVVKFLAGLVGFAFALFPTWEPPPSPGLAAFSAANLVLPLDAISTCFGIAAGMAFAGLTVWVIMKAINVIRGSGA